MSLLLAARGLRKRYGGVVAIDDVSFAIDEREPVCMIGPNGAGKSTLLNMLCGIVKPDDGELVFDGGSLSGLPEYQFARRGILRKFQVPSVFSEMSVRRNLIVAGDASRQNYTDNDVDVLLDRLALPQSASVMAETLSHGDRQRLELGLCLMGRPKLLLLDEPTAGLTVRETSEVARLLLELTATTAIVVIEHDMGFVRQLNCRTCVLHQGRLINDGSFAEIEKDAVVRAIYLARE
jgi:ABC-type uncharacterized transport system ATPase subunit